MMKALWYKYLFGRSVPWVDMHTDANGVEHVKAYNQAFLKSIKDDLADIAVGSLTPDEWVKLWVSRRNYEHEEPKLEVVHGSISDEGNISIKLEWNDAFIRLLRKQGINGVSEDDMVQQYLALVSQHADNLLPDIDTGEGAPLPTDEEVKAAFKRELQQRKQA